MKSVKIKSSKYKKMWIKKKKEICTLNHRNNHLVKSLLNVEASYQELLSNNQNLELEKNEVTNFETKCLVTLK